MARRVLLAFLLAGLFVVGLGVGTPQGRTVVKTLLFIPQVVPAMKVRPQEWFTPDPRVTEVRFPAAGEAGEADLYQPASKGRYAAVVLFLGVNPAGRDDPQVVGLARALARAGMVVLIPWSQSMAQNRIEPEEMERLVEAFQYLQGLEVVDPQRVGMGGFCVGASIALVAAADPRIQDHVAFVNFFGGYYDAADLVKQISSRTRFYGRTQEPWQPGDLTRRVFTTHLIDRLSDPGERALLARIFVDGDQEAKGQARGLSPEGLAVYRILEGVPLEQADGVIQLLPLESQEFLRQVSPRTYVSDVKAPVLVMADREDTLVPSTESRRLAEALAPRGGVYYTEFSFFQHMDPTRPVGPLTFAREVTKLFLHLYRILRVGT